MGGSFYGLFRRYFRVKKKVFLCLTNLKVWYQYPALISARNKLVGLKKGKNISYLVLVPPTPTPPELGENNRVAKSQSVAPMFHSIFCKEFGGFVRGVPKLHYFQLSFSGVPLTPFPAARSLQEIQGVPKSSLESQGLPRSPKEPQGVLRSLHNSPGVLRSSEEYHRVPKSLQEFSGVPRSLKESPGIPRSPQ